MSENVQKDMEQTVLEETAKAQAAETVQKEEKKEKKGFIKKDPKKEKIAELEKQVEELKNQVAKDKDDYIRLMAELDNFR